MERYMNELVESKRFGVYFCTLGTMLLLIIVMLLNTGFNRMAFYSDAKLNNVANLDSILESKGYERGFFGECRTLRDGVTYRTGCASLLTRQQLSDFRQSESLQLGKTDK